MAEEKKPKEITYQIISDEYWVEISPEGKPIVGRRIAFSTPDIPYESFFLPENEYSKERIEEEIKKKVLEFKKPEYRTGKIIIE